MMKISEGDAAWLGLLAYVVAYDAYAMICRHETLTSSYYRALADPKRRYITILTWGYLTGHLFKIIPQKYDFMAQMGQIASHVDRLKR